MTLDSDSLLGTTVRIRDADKEKLEKLQAMATLSSGGKVSQEDVLGALLENALTQGESFMMGAFGGKLPLSDEEFEKVRALTSDWGFSTKEEDIDKDLYGTRSTGRRR